MVVDFFLQSQIREGTLSSSFRFLFLGSERTKGTLKTLCTYVRDEKFITIWDGRPVLLGRRKNEV